MSNKLIILVLLILISTSSFSLFGVGDVGAFDLQNYIANLNTQMETVQNGLKLTEQARSLEQQLVQVRQMAEDTRENMKSLSNGDFNNLLNNMSNTLNTLSRLDSDLGEIVDSNDRFLNQYRDLFNKSNDDYNMQSYTPEEVDHLKYKLYKAKDFTKNAVYHAMNNARVAGRLDSNEANNTKRLISTLRSSNGSLQALQAIGELISETNTTLLSIRSVLKENATIAGSMNTYLLEKDKEKQGEDLERRKLEKNNQNRAQKVWDKQQQIFSKPIILGF